MDTTIQNLNEGILDLKQYSEILMQAIGSFKNLSVDKLYKIMNGTKDGLLILLRATKGTLQSDFVKIFSKKGLVLLVKFKNMLTTKIVLNKEARIFLSTMLYVLFLVMTVSGVFNVAQHYSLIIPTITALLNNEVINNPAILLPVVELMVGVLGMIISEKHLVKVYGLKPTIIQAFLDSNSRSIEGEALQQDVDLSSYCKKYNCRPENIFFTITQNVQNRISMGNVDDVQVTVVDRSGKCIFVLEWFGDEVSDFSCNL